jgi:hypothetical protein
MLLSLVAAVPGGVLAYLMVAAFLTRSGDMTGTFQILAGLTLVLSVLVAVIPVGILLFSRKEPQADKEAKEGEPDESSDEEVIDEAVEPGFGEADEAMEIPDEDLEAVEDDFADDEFDLDEEDSDSAETIEGMDAFSDDDVDEDFEIDGFEEDDSTSSR